MLPKFGVTYSTRYVLLRFNKTSPLFEEVMLYSECAPVENEDVKAVAFEIALHAQKSCFVLFWRHWLALIPASDSFNGERTDRLRRGKRTSLVY